MAILGSAAIYSHRAEYGRILEYILKVVKASQNGNRLTHQEVALSYQKKHDKGHHEKVKLELK